MGLLSVQCFSTLRGEPPLPCIVLDFQDFNRPAKPGCAKRGVALAPESVPGLLHQTSATSFFRSNFSGLTASTVLGVRLRVLSALGVKCNRVDLDPAAQQDPHTLDLDPYPLQCPPGAM